MCETWESRRGETLGSHIYSGQSRYAPEAHAGRALLGSVLPEQRAGRRSPPAASAGLTSSARRAEPTRR